MNAPTALGVHIYAGGFTLGMRSAGLNTVGNVERYTLGNETTRKNLKIPVLNTNPDGSSEDFGKAFRLFSKEKINVLYGNPPCVAFSRLGNRAYLDHPTIRDWWDWTYTVENLEPDVAVLECVQQAWTKGRPLLDQFNARFTPLGYKPYVFLTDAYLHGAAQLRQRFHLVISKVKLQFEMPVKGETTGFTVAQMLNWLELHGEKQEFPMEKLQAPAYYRWLGEYVKPGQNCRKVWMHLMGKTESTKGKNKGAPPFIAQRLGLDRPAPTFAGGPDFFHPTEWRSITPQEMAVLSGYPDWYKFGRGPRGTNLTISYQEVARAVMPPIGKYLGKVFKKGLEQGEGVTDQRLEVINYTSLAREWLAGTLKAPKLEAADFGKFKQPEVPA